MEKDGVAETVSALDTLVLVVFSINQSNITQGLASLPVNLAGCARLVCLLGPTCKLRAARTPTECALRSDPARALDLSPSPQTSPACGAFSSCTRLR